MYFIREIWKAKMKKLKWKLYQSHAFPTSRPFWRCVCKECGWMILPYNEKPKEEIECPECLATGEIDERN